MRMIGGSVARFGWRSVGGCQLCCQSIIIFLKISFITNYFLKAGEVTMTSFEEIKFLKSGAAIRSYQTSSSRTITTSNIKLAPSDQHTVQRTTHNHKKSITERLRH